MTMTRLLLRMKLVSLLKGADGFMSCFFLSSLISGYGIVGAWFGLLFVMTSIMDYERR